MCQPEHGHWTSPAHCVLHAVRSDSVTINQYQCSLLRWVYRYFLAAVIIHFLLRLLFSVKKVFRIVTFVLWFTLNIMTLTKLCRTNRDRIFINGIKIQQKMRIGTNKYEKEPWEWPNFYFFSGDEAPKNYFSEKAVPYHWLSFDFQSGIWKLGSKYNKRKLLQNQIQLPKSCCS